MKLHSAANAAKGLVLPLVMRAAWEWASRQGAGVAYVFVPLEQWWQGLIDLRESGELALHLRASLQRTLQGLLIGGLLGIATGTLMAQSRVADRLIGPLFHADAQRRADAMARLDGGGQ